MPHTIRTSRVGRLLCVLIAALVGPAFLSAQSPQGFTRTGDMITARSVHTATLLPGGKVLIAGGSNSGSSLASAELYDPRSGTFNPAGAMATGRMAHTATLLPDGHVLIAGGYASLGNTTASAELFDPSSGTFRTTGALNTARAGHTAILLSTGKVLFVGGYGTSAYPNLAAAEIYEPATGSFTPGPAYVGRGGCDFCAPATLLADGRVLFTGQYPAQVYDPLTNAFGAAGMATADHSTAVLLRNGRVLLAGGESTGRMSSAELYDPTNRTFASTGNMAWRRVWHRVIGLPDGKALATGGETESCTSNACWFAGSTASAELYDPSAGTFVSAGDMAESREIHTATLLEDGRVLITGGIAYGGIGLYRGSLASAELYTPDALVRAPVLVSLSGDREGPGAIFHAGTRHAATADDPAAAGELLDISSTGLDPESVIPPQVAIGGRLSEIVSLTTAPGASAVTLIRVRIPSGVTPGPAVPVRMLYLERPSNQVTIGVR